MSVIYNKYLLFSGFKCTDVFCGFKYFKTSFIRNLPLKSKTSFLFHEIMLYVDDRVVLFGEFEVCHQRRIFGRSKCFKISNIVASIKDFVLINVWKYEGGFVPSQEKGFNM